jgi:hypothetical protein
MVKPLSVRQGSSAALGSMILHRSLLSTGGFNPELGAAIVQPSDRVA